MIYIFLSERVSSVTMCVSFEKCDHGPQRSFVKPHPGHYTVSQVFDEFHSSAKVSEKEYNLLATASLDLKETKGCLEIHPITTMKDLRDMGVVRVNFLCQPNQKTQKAKMLIETTTKKTVNAFEKLMKGQTRFPECKESRYYHIFMHLIIKLPFESVLLFTCVTMLNQHSRLHIRSKLVNFQKPQNISILI